MVHSNTTLLCFTRIIFGFATPAHFVSFRCSLAFALLASRSRDSGKMPRAKAKRATESAGCVLRKEGAGAAFSGSVFTLTGFFTKGVSLLQAFPGNPSQLAIVLFVWRAFLICLFDPHPSCLAGQATNRLPFLFHQEGEVLGTHVSHSDSSVRLEIWQAERFPVRV